MYTIDILYYCYTHNHTCHLLEQKMKVKIQCLYHRLSVAQIEGRPSSATVACLGPAIALVGQVSSRIHSMTLQASWNNGILAG